MTEDLSHQPEAEEENSDEDRNRFIGGSFLESWLNKGEDSEKEETEDDDEEKLPSKLSRKFRDFFKSLVGLELIPKNLEPAVEAVEDDDSEINEVEEFEIEQDTHDNEPEGLLVIPHTLEATEDGLSISEAVINSESLDGRYNNSESSSSSLTKERSAKKPEKKSVFSAGDILKKEKETFLKRKIEKLQKENKTIQTEREEVIKKQEKFERQLDEQVASAMALDQMLRESNQSQQPEIRNTGLPKSQEVSQSSENPQVAKLKQFVENEFKSRPEVVLDKVESAAEKDVPIEDLYERRHEIKGENSAFTDSNRAVATSSKLPAKSRSYLYPKRSTELNIPSSTKVSAKSDISNLWKQKGLYTHAAKNGFWTAIVILLIVFVITVVF